MSEMLQVFHLALHFSVHGSTHYLKITKLQYVNTSTTIELQIKKWQSINKPIATRIPTRETWAARQVN